MSNVLLCRLYIFYIFYLFPLTVCLYSWESNSLPGYHNLHNGKETSKSFVNEWIVEMEGGEEVAQLVALELGYEYGGPVSQ